MIMKCDAFRDLVHLYNLKNVKNIHGGVLLLVKLQNEVWNFIKTFTPTWTFFTFLKLYKWYQIAQSVSNIQLNAETSNHCNPISKIAKLCKK